MSIISAIGKAVSSAAKWVGAGFRTIKQDGAKIGVSILEGYKTDVENGVIPCIATIIDVIFSTHVAADVVAGLNKEVPKLLAGALLVEGLPDNATPDQLEAFNNAAYTAFTGLPANAKSRFYATFSADIYAFVQTLSADGGKLTYAELMAASQKAYQDIKKAEADEAASKLESAQTND